MSSLFSLPATIEQQLSYWKWDFTSLDLFSGELAYSLIYDNVRPDRVQEALQTVGLDALPNYFILIQIDDYLTISKQLEITREFFQKDLVVNTIRSCLENLQVPGFAANLINSDRVICFLCLEDLQLEPVEEFLGFFVSEIRRRVYLHTSYTLSVSTSGRCTKLSHFPAMYIQVEQALNRSFYCGQGADLCLQSVDTSAAPIDMNRHYSHLLASISQHDHSLIRQRVKLLFRDLNEAQFLPQRVRIEVIRLICRLETHCLECGILERTVEGISRHASEEILSSPFFFGIQTLFSTFCEQISYCLEQYSINENHELEASIKAYIAEHYRQNIRLQDIAEAFHFSPSYFTQVFKKHFGITLTEYITQFRVEKSLQLLSKYNLSVELVAAEVGFSSYSYFCTTFKKMVGMTPKEYRKAHCAQ